MRYMYCHFVTEGHATYTSHSCYLKASFISLRASDCTTTIWEWHLFQRIQYLFGGLLFEEVLYVGHASFRLSCADTGCVRIPYG